MSIIKNMVRSIIRWANSEHKMRINDDDILSSSSTLGYPAKMPNLADDNRGMNFTVYSAVGGKIIQLRDYDARTDRMISNLYIVTDKEDLGMELGHIITRESLSR